MDAVDGANGTVGSRERAQNSPEKPTPVNPQSPGVVGQFENGLPTSH